MKNSWRIHPLCHSSLFPWGNNPCNHFGFYSSSSYSMHLHTCLVYIVCVCVDTYVHRYIYVYHIVQFTLYFFPCPTLCLGDHSVLAHRGLLQCFSEKKATWAKMKPSVPYLCSSLPQGQSLWLVSCVNFQSYRAYVSILLYGTVFYTQFCILWFSLGSCILEHFVLYGQSCLLFNCSVKYHWWIFR